MFPYLLIGNFLFSAKKNAKVKNHVTESQDQPSKKSVDVAVHIQEAKISKNHVDDSHDQPKPSNISGEEQFGEDVNADNVAEVEAKEKEIADGISKGELDTSC